MITKWIICGIFILSCTPILSQVSFQKQKRIDRLLQNLETTESNYQITFIADDLLRLLDTTQISKSLYQVYYKKAVAGTRLGNYTQALINLQSASRIAHALPDSFFIAQSAYRMGSIQYNQNHLEAAREQFQFAVDLFYRLDSLMWVAYAHNAFGLLERREKHWDMALYYYRQSHEILTSLGLEHLTSVPLNNIGDVYFNLGQYERSLQIFRESLALAEKQNNINAQAIAHLNIGQCWRELEKYDEALKEIRIGLSLAERNGLNLTTALGLRDLSNTFEKMDLPDSALSYLKAHIHWKDSLRKIEENTQLEELYVAYETEKAQNELIAREREIEALKQDKRLSYVSNYLLIVLLLLALVLISFFFLRNRMKRKLAESELRNQKLESDQMRATLEGQKKDLTNLALEIARKNELFNKTNQELTEIQKEDLPKDKRRRIKKLIRFNAQQLRINEDLEELQVNIEKVNSDFFAKLTEIAPDLTPSEKHLCALLRLNLGTKEIAAIRNITPKSVDMARYRLRKKLPPEAQDDIYAFVQGI